MSDIYMKILILYDKSANFESILYYEKYIRDIEFFFIKTKDIYSIIDEKYDFLIYQTFPVEKHDKYDKINNDICDEYFKLFDGPKLLFDTHDDGNIDGFIRFDKVFDRIKTTVSYRNINKLKIKFILGDPVFYEKYDRFNYNPYIYFSYNCRLKKHGYGHYIREQIYDLIKKNKFLVNTNYQNDYQNHIKNCKVTICPPGNCGLYEIYSNENNINDCKKITDDEIIPSGISKRHLYALKYGSLLFCYESFKNLKIFNNFDLIENVDYMCFNLKNFADKMNLIIKNPKLVDKIRKSGQDKFRKGAYIYNNCIKFKEFLIKYKENYDIENLNNL